VLAFWVAIYKPSGRARPSALLWKKTPSTYICIETGFPGHVFEKIFFLPMRDKCQGMTSSHAVRV
jgi:hypothetical protein